MDGAWQSSDGGSIPVLGASSALVTAVGDTTIVAAGANTAGVIIRTAVAGSIGAATDVVSLVCGTRRILTSVGQAAAHCREIFVPPGTAIVGSISGSGRLDVTFDIL